MAVTSPILPFTPDQQGQHSWEIIHVVLRSLSSIDNRLIEHGERVAYLAREIAAVEPPLPVDPKALFVMCVLHDIGAYKTEEIDNMVAFESSDVHRHAAYGYLFLKHLNLLSTHADAILYHHTDYQHFAHIHTPNSLYAQLIYLADRLDLLLLDRRDTSVLQSFVGTRFSPDLVRRFYAADADGHLSRCLQESCYRQDTEQVIHGLNFSDAEVLDFLNLLVYAMDFRSEYTVSHTANTTSISVRLGQLLELPEDTLQKLYFSAMFHDIGKISIPVEILEKDGRLTGEEMAIMRTHVVQSETILRGVVDDEVCDIAVRHHEKLNGAGYPYGLTGDQLTIPQRIVAVADILSALSSQRSYKEGYSKERTLEILHGMRDRGELCVRVCQVVDENYDSILHDAGLVADSMRSLYDEIAARLEQTMALLPE